MAGELITRHPHPALRGVVRAYHGYAERTATPMRRRELPAGRAVLVIGTGPPLVVEDHDGTTQRLVSFAAGMHTAPAFTAHAGVMTGIEVELTPLGARAVLGVPMSEITGRTIALEDLLGPRAAELTERAQDAGTWDERFALVEAQVLRWAATKPEAPREIAWAYGRLPNLSVATIAAELGWSQRRLRSAFLEHVGLRPKTAARVLRFERAVALLRRGAPPASAAHEAGYSDQAHFTRESRALGGTTPTGLLTEGLAKDPMRPDRFLQDRCAAAA